MDTLCISERAYAGQTQDDPNLYYNQNAGDPTKMAVRAGRQPAWKYSDRTWETVSGR